MLRHTFSGPTSSSGGSPPPTVVLLHGFALDARMWRPQIPALSAIYRVLTLDLPGFGPSPVDAAGRTLSACVDELLGAVLDAPAHVVGLSLGGAVAVDLALAFGRHVRSITLIDALLMGLPTGITGTSVAVARATAGDIPGAREAWMEDPLFAYSAASSPASAAAARAMVNDYSGDHWRARASTRFEVREPLPRLEEIQVPALVIVGEHDTPAFRAMSETYAASIPRATLRVIPKAGHLASMEAPEAVNAELLALFATA